MSDAAATVETGEPPAKRGGFLATIERIGDKVPHPAMIFIALCAIVIVLSHILYLFDVSATQEIAEPVPVAAEVYYPAGSVVHELVPIDGTEESQYVDDYEIQTETIPIKSLLTSDGIRFLFTSPVANFNGFGVVGVILVAMAGVGVAEQSGLIAALIRRLVKLAPAWSITYIIVFIGLLSSVASDAGYLVLIPLGAAAYHSLGRHPLAGIAAAYAGVSAGFGVNILITPFDGVLAEVTTEAARLVDPDANVAITDNFYFGVGSTIFLTVVMTIIVHRLIEPRLGTFTGTVDPVESPDENEHQPAGEARGLRFAGLAMLAVVVGVALLVAIPGAPLRNPETDSIIVDSPFMNSLIVIVTLIFLAGGIAYGIGADTLRGSSNVIGSIVTTFQGLAGLIFLLLIIAQFIAYFNFTNMATVLASGLADILKQADIGALWLLLLFIVVTYLLDIIIPGILPKWAIFAPVFVPLMLQLDVAPQTVLAAYRIGDSPSNVITPLMVYLPFIVVVCQRYKKDSGLGTVVSLMMPVAIWVAITWLVFFAIWYLLGIPLGPGAPVKL
ncbi:MAG TPA: AbgT family transporter [Ilumatobacteraceae bacterium]|nr:AbgT family transporter [Ilumatobacteraceae bacterium]